MKQMVHKMDILCQIKTRQDRIERLKERWWELFDMGDFESPYQDRIDRITKRLESQIDTLQMRLQRLH